MAQQPRKIQLNEVGRKLFLLIKKWTEAEKTEAIEKYKLIKSPCPKCKKETYGISIVTETKCLKCGEQKPF